MSENGILKLMQQYSNQLATVENHTAAEGYATPNIVVLDSYDRTLHPWLHGRRPADIIEKLESWWP